ncbi:hypothetical protein GCM10020358_73300 [Amorphoplanes nipponensis]
MTATVLGGLLLGAALLTTGTANAEQVEGGGRQVVFAGGGVLGLSCGSTPSVETLTVPTEGRVRLVNRTGRGARLLLNGESRGAIANDGSTEVVFRRGTTAVTLDPSCAVTDQTTPVLVTTSPAPTEQPDPIPVPVDTASNPAAPPVATSGPGTPDAPADSGSALPDSVAPPTRPQRPPATAAGRPTKARPGKAHTNRGAAHSVATAAQAMPQGGAVPRLRTGPVRATAGAPVPAFSGMPPGDDKTLSPGVPALDLPSSPPVAAPALPADPAPGTVAAEPVAALRPLPESQPIGLLAVIAMVSVLGVALAIIRAFVSERASRASVA